MKNQQKQILTGTHGHMVKTKRQIIEDLKLIDIVVEILDARIPISSQNPDIGNYIKEKTRIIILNKSDLADEEQNKKWLNYFNNKGIKAVIVDSNSGMGINKVISTIEELYNKNNSKFLEKGRVGKSIRIMIVGIPNVGKSSFINRISKKSQAKVGNKPGVTRQKQWVKVNNDIELLDTPGVLWPKFQDEKVALNLAFTGTINDDIMEITEIGFALLKFLLLNYFSNVVNRYNLDEKQIKDILQDNNREENENILNVMEEIGRKRGAIISGGNIDIERVANIIIDEFRSGKLGRMTLERL